MSIELQVDFDTYQTYHDHSDEKFGMWEASYSHSVNGVYLRTHPNDPYMEKITVDFDVNVGDTVYVMVMIYSTGDSFGRADGRSEVMWVFKDRIHAMDQVKKLEEVDNRAESVIITTESGKDIKLSNPVFGFFENLENVELHRCVVE